jgi:tetratricopeptide (TPR) repeat protein
VAAFLLYEIISFNLQMPSAAAVFFLAVGALMGQGRGGREFTLRFARWPAAVGALGAIFAAIVVLWQPVYQRTSLTADMEQARYDRRWDRLADLAGQAAQADPLDPISAADAAKAIGLRIPQEDRLQARQDLDRAYDWAREAVRRDGQNAAWQLQAGTVAWHFDLVQALAHMERAVGLDPRDPRMRLQYARMLLDALRPADALRQLDAAEAIDRGLLSDSSERLTPVERDQVRSMRQSAEKRGA